ncbi:hypothetical protein U9M48_008767, partial [Paspalum notatum var. saurae]
MDRSLIGGRPHQTLKPYTTLAVGYPMAGGGWEMVPWCTIVFQGHKGQAKGDLLTDRREPSKKLNRRKLEDFKRKLVPPNYFSTPITQGPPLGDAQSWFGSNTLEFRPTQLSPQVPPNYFSTPSGQGSPPRDAQGSQPPPNQIIPSGQGSKPQQWIYPTQGPPFGDASQSQPPPQWEYPGQPMMMYRGQQPMFYPASQPPYYMPWHSTAPPMTPP